MSPIELYHSLMKLSENDNSPFYYEDKLSSDDNYTYRIFLYRLASYSEFKAQGALESRGIMYRIEDSPVLVSRPFEKFFNWHEHPEYDRPKAEDVIQLDEKFDGSLIRTYIDKNGILRFASKGSLYSEHAIAATKIFESYNDIMKDILRFWAKEYTLLFEYCSPEHQIVVRYSTPELKLIGIRHTVSGDYVSLKPETSVYQDIPKVLSELYDSDRTNFEGYVAITNTGKRFKVKTKKYLELHKLKDDINNPSRLFECVLNENADDLANAFQEYPEIVENVRLMEFIVLPAYRSWLKVVKDLYSTVRDMEKIDAVNYLKENVPDLFHIVISLYNKKTNVKYKEWFTKLYEENLIEYYNEQLTSVSD